MYRNFCVIILGLVAGWLVVSLVLDKTTAPSTSSVAVHSTEFISQLNNSIPDTEAKNESKVAYEAEQNHDLKVPQKQFKRMHVNNGRLYFENGDEVALWGVNFQPSLGWELNRFVRAGLVKWKNIDQEAYNRIVDKGLDEIQKMRCDVVRLHLAC
ncbi:MAG: hypothetical protein HQL32_11025, partial [Planctomycetes bacterium]|nr:hypothetical protein [Planctomycetota bacterium]